MQFAPVMAICSFPLGFLKSVYYFIVSHVFKRPWWKFLFFIVGCCCFVGIYIGESTFRLHSLDLIVYTETFYINLPDVVQSFLKHCNHFSLFPIVLDKGILSCISHSTKCNSLNNTDSLVFGFFEEHASDAKRMSDKLEKSIWTITKDDKHYLFKNNEFRIVLVNIEKRPQYWFVPEFLSANMPSFAILNTTLIAVSLNNQEKLLMPASVDYTLRQLETSRFMECNHTVAKQLRKSSPYLFQTTPLINSKHLEDMAYMRDLLHSVGIFPFLFGGTALGWYRECGIIPYTTDLDFAAMASEYNIKLEKLLKNDTRLKLYWILGKPSDSLEISVYTGKMKIDLFMVYENGNSSWVGGMIVPEKVKLQWYYPKIEGLCTADLKGHLFHVPCNVEEILTSDYGPFWYKPHHESKFLWHSSHKNVKRNGFWSQKEWPGVYRTFYVQ